MKTREQIEAEILAIQQANHARREKVMALERAERIGITVSGITLAAADKDRSLFAQGLILLREAENLQPDEESKAAFRASMQTIADASGVTHTMNVTDLRTLLVAYGAAYQALWTAAAQPVN